MDTKLKKNKSILLYYASIGLTIITLLSACDIVNKGQLPSKYIDDTTLTTKIKSHILTEKGINSSDVHIESYDSTVQITGFVKDKQTYNKVANIIKNTAGVKKIINNLIIRN